MNKITGIICLVAIGLLVGSASADVVTYQQGTSNAFVTNYAGNQDVELQSYSDGVNQNGNAYIRAGEQTAGWGHNVFRGLVKFDLSSLAGQYSAINSVTFTYYNDSSYVSTGSNNSYGEAWFYALSTANAGWSETVSTWDKLGGGGGASWAGSTGASTAGVDYDSVKIAEFNYPRYLVAGMPSWVAVTLTGHTGLTLTDLINQWSGNQASNAGFVVRSQQEESTYALDYLHINGASSAFAPQLTIDYTVPEPVTMGLLAVGGIGMLLRRRA